MSVIITAPVWHTLGTPGGRSARRASEDAVDRRPANAGEPVHPMVAEAGRDSSAHARVPVTGHGDPLNEPLLGILRRGQSNRVPDLAGTWAARARPGMLVCRESRKVRAGPGSAAATAGDARLLAPLTSFVGRVEERAALIDALRAHRMVTAVGPGGVGKTRLARRVAADLTGRFADGAWFVDLVPVTDSSMIAPAIAAALGLGEHRSRSAEDTVIGWLASRESLLVLDNCEHLLDGGGPGREAAGGLLAAVGADHQPGEVAGAFRVGVPGARAVR